MACEITAAAFSLPSQVAPPLMLNARWVVDDRGRVVLSADAGEALPVSSVEVFRAVFHGMSAAHGLKFANPAEDLSYLSFSRIPAEPAVRIANLPGDGATCEIGVVAGDTFLAVSVDSDQVIVDNRWLPIDPDALQSTHEWLASNAITPGQRLHLRQLILLRRPDEKPFRLVDDFGADRTSEGEAGHTDAVAGLQATLYPYQAKGVSFLEAISSESAGCVLADEMGLGKTLQIIALFQSERNAGRQPSLVVAPATLLENWRREIGRFAPELRVLIHSGSSRAGIPAILQEFQVVVTSYETLIRDEALLDAVNWNVVVLDEAQAIKSPSAQRTLAAKRLGRRVSIAVTGTPVENRLEDLWSLSDFALPGLLGDLSVFRGRFEDTLGDARQLGLLVSPAILRRRIADVAIDLPELIEIPQPLQLPAGLTSMYEEIRTGGAGAELGHQLTILTRLRQFCADPSLVTSGDRVLREESPKSIRLMELAEEIFASSEKCLVFAGFTEAIDLIGERLAEAWPQAFVRSIDGRTPVDVRQTIVDDFTSFTGPAALVMNPRAAGVGLNITAANHVVHFTPEWNPALTSQASARAYRMKQTKPVTVHHMFFVDTVEEAMIDRAEFKRDLAAGAVVGHDGQIDQTELVDALSRSPLHRATPV